MLTLHCPRQVLEALVDTAFKARFDVDRITKERSAVVAEAQMMNTMEYRVDCALLRSLHRECSLGSRFPIGRVEQVCPSDLSVGVGFSVFNQLCSTFHGSCFPIGRVEQVCPSNLMALFCFPWLLLRH